MDETASRHLIHGLFEATILMKGIAGLLELATGIALSFMTTRTIYSLILLLSERGLLSWSDITSDYLVNLAYQFTPGTKNFIVFYFLFYGIVNLFLVYFLAKGKLWSYPVAIICFSIFIVYQVIRASLHHSGLLLFLALFDSFLVVLTWLEYRRVKNPPNYPASNEILNS